jgi:glycosyltransferase involved in cell wall biosynthesis
MRSETVRNPEQNPEPLVTVLVPSYNHEKYVVECLESIRNLSYKRLELIVSDDCSRDGTFALAKQWAQENIGRFERTLVVRQDKNVGIVGNLQFLFDNAQGEYISYIASDDMFVKSAIICRLEILQKNRNIDAVFGNAQLISGSGEVLREQFIPRWITRELSSRKLLVSSLLLNWCSPGPVMMLRREAVLENGSLGILPTDLHGEDKYIYIRLAARGKLQFIDAVVAKYRLVQGSFSQSPLLQGFILETCLHADKKNRHLVSGLDRCAIEVRIARFDLELNKGYAVIYELKKLILRCMAMHLKIILFIRALISKAWSLLENDRSADGLG